MASPVNLTEGGDVFILLIRLNYSKIIGTLESELYYRPQHIIWKLMK